MKLKLIIEIAYRMMGIFFLFAAVTLVIPDYVTADEVKFPVSAYTEKELAKVREWEKVWVGKKIDKNNIDQVAEFLPASFVQIMKEPVKWGSSPEGIYFNIIPYKQYLDTTGMAEAVKKYSPTVKMDAAGMIQDFTEIAGIPFPNPKTGLEVAWNYDFNSLGDAHNYFRTGPNIDPGVATERTAKQDAYWLYWIHRVDVDPKPKIVKNPKKISKGLFMHLYDPPENKNTRFFNIRYIENRPDDGYIYYSPFRRLRRMGAASRTDAIDGTDMIYDDGGGWDGHTLRNTYKLMGKKELLCCRQGDFTKWLRKPGESTATNINRERVNLYVVEAIDKDPNYLYGKRVWYLDGESYHIMWQEIYDRLGRKWKLFERKTNMIKTLSGTGNKSIEINTGMYDLQRVHSGWNTDEIRGVGQSLDEVNPGIFTIQNLQKVGY